MSALSDLLATQPMSARDAARKAEGMGIHLPAGTIAAYWSGRHGRPSPDTLTRLAQVIDISLRRLQQAAWGAEAPLGEYRPPTEANLLDDRQRRALDELIRSIVKTQGATDGVESTTEQGTPREANSDKKTPGRGNVRDLNRRKQGRGPDTDEVPAAARSTREKTRGQVEYEDHAAAGEESQDGHIDEEI